MTDINLRMLGDAAGAVEMFKSTGASALAMANVIKDVMVDCVKSFGEAERVSKQLARAAGDNAEAFEAQADAMSKQLGVEDEHIKKLQTLALNYGSMPTQIEAMTRATLDWSAATDKDARSAMLELIKAVEAGTGSLDRGRITFKVTGDQATDTAAAIEALSAKFGGAAETDANTMEGRVRKASIAWGELKEAFGGFLATAEAKTGALEKIANVLNNMQDSQNWSEGTRGEKRDAPGGPSVTAGGGGASNTSLKTHFGKGVDVTFGDVDLAATKPEKIEAERKAYADKLKREEEALDRQLEAYNKYEDNKWVMQREALKRELDTETKHDEQMLRTKHDLFEQETKNLEDIEKANADSLKRQIQEWEKGTKEIRKILDQQKRDNERMAAEWSNMGKQIGSAVINGIINGIKGGAQGKGGSTENQVFMVMMDIFNVVFNMLLSEIGGGFATPASNALFAKMKETGSPDLYSDPDTRHEGGWTTPRYYHAGGRVLARDEVSAVLQSGERVVSRTEVSRMGGMGAVDAAISGRGSGVTNIYAFDTSSMLDFVSGGQKMDRAMINAARTGRGQLYRLFSGGRN